MKAQISEPTILTEKSLSYTPASWYGARSRENKQHSIVREYFESLGFTVSRSDSMYTVANLDGVVASFLYRETEEHMYVDFSVTQDGKVSDISLLRKIAESIEVK